MQPFESSVTALPGLLFTSLNFIKMWPLDTKSICLTSCICWKPKILIFLEPGAGFIRKQNSLWLRWHYATILVVIDIFCTFWIVQSCSSSSTWRSSSSSSSSLSSSSSIALFYLFSSPKKAWGIYNSTLIRLFKLYVLSKKVIVRSEMWTCAHSFNINSINSALLLCYEKSIKFLISKSKSPSLTRW